MNLFRIAGATTIGTSHIKNGKPCQDKIYSKKSNHVATIALADGAGSCSKSDLGAEICTRYIVDFLCNNFDKTYLLNEQEISEKINKNIKKPLEEMANELNISSKELSSTLLFVAVKGNKYIAGHIGDGLIGKFDENGSQVLSTPENGEYANQTFFITMPEADKYLRIYKDNLNSTLGFILMSDGSYESLFDTQNNILASANLTFFSWLVDKQNTIEALNKSIEENLASKFTKRTTDDCSVILLSTKHVDGWLDKVIKIARIEEWWEKLKSYLR